MTATLTPARTAGRIVLMFLILNVFSSLFAPAAAFATSDPIGSSENQASQQHTNVEDAFSEGTGLTPDTPIDEVAPSAEVPEAPDPRGIEVGRRNPSMPNSVDEAIESDLVDADLVSAISESGSATALILFEETNFVAEKAALMRNLPRTVKVVDELENLPILEVTVSSTDMPRQQIAIAKAAIW